MEAHHCVYLSITLYTLKHKFCVISKQYAMVIIHGLSVHKLTWEHVDAHVYVALRYV